MFKFEKPEVTFDTKGIEERFGIGSDAQREWSRIVFDGTRKYLPKVTGQFESLSYIHSEQVFDQGELVYPGPYGHLLYEGIVYVDPETGSAWARPGVTKIKTDKELTYNQEANPLAGAKWVERAADDLLPVWEADMQRMIDRGLV